MAENLCIFVGLIGKDIELRETEKGTAVCTFDLATKKTWRGGARTDWHRCVAYAAQAKYLAEYAGIGDMIYFIGEATNKKFEAPDGVVRNLTEFVATKVELLRKKIKQEDKPDKPDKPARKKKKAE